MTRYRSAEEPCFDTQGDARANRKAGRTPMLDVMFILLIFFTITATFVRASGLDVNAQTIQTTPTEAIAVVIGIGADDELWLNGIKTDLRALRSRLEVVSAQNPLTSLIINPDPDSTTDRLIQVMDTSRLAGLESISFARSDL